MTDGNAPADSESGDESAGLNGLMVTAIGLALLGGLASVVATNPIGWITTTAVVVIAISRLRITRSRVYA